MPPPAVSHCTSPRPKRAVAPSESEWSMRPWRTIGDRLEPAVRVLREAGHDLAVVHVPAVDAGEVLADLAPVERRRRAELVVARRVGVVVVDAEQEGVDRRPLGRPAGPPAGRRRRGVVVVVSVARAHGTHATGARNLGTGTGAR